MLPNTSWEPQPAARALQRCWEFRDHLSTQGVPVKERTLTASAMAPSNHVSSTKPGNGARLGLHFLSTQPSGPRRTTSSSSAARRQELCLCYDQNPGHGHTSNMLNRISLNCSFSLFLKRVLWLFQAPKQLRSMLSCL